MFSERDPHSRRSKCESMCSYLRQLRLFSPVALLLRVPKLPVPRTPGTQQSPPTQPKAEDGDEDGFFRYHRGMTGPGMMGHDHGHHEWNRGRNIAGPMMMRIIFSLMDADGDGKLTLQEFQAAHERIFKAMDTDHDGTVTLEEMQAFMRGQ